MHPSCHAAWGNNNSKEKALKPQIAVQGLLDASSAAVSRRDANL